MSKAEQAIGKPLDRVDGRLKVTGAARYAAEAQVPDVLYGVLVTSTIARGPSVANTSTARKRPVDRHTTRPPRSTAIRPAR